MLSWILLQVLHSISDYRLEIIRGMDKYIEEQVRGSEGGPRSDLG